jgi:hypothetical protein
MQDSDERIPTCCDTVMTVLLEGHLLVANSRKESSINTFHQGKYIKIGGGIFQDHECKQLRPDVG